MTTLHESAANHLMGKENCVRVVWDDHEGNQHEHTFRKMEDARLEAAALRQRYDYVEIFGREEKSIQIEVTEAQLEALDKHLDALHAHYEVEAAAFAALGPSGQKIATQRLIDAKEAEALRDFFLNV